MHLSLETLTYIIRTGLPSLVEQIDLVNAVIIFLSQTTLLIWLTFLLGSQTVIFTVLLCWIFLSSDTSICSTMAFPPLGNSDVAVSVSIDFSSYSQGDAPFHRISRLDWDGLCDDLRDVPWEGIFKLSASAAASEFCEWGRINIDVYIPHQKYQVKPHSSPWFSVACAAAIVHRNHFFHLYQKDKSSHLKQSSDRLGIIAKGFLKLPNLHMLIKQRSASLPRNLALATFGNSP